MSAWESDLVAAWVTVRLAMVTTAILLVIATPLAWWLAAGRSPLRAAVAALVALPLVLSPTVIGFYLLVAFAPSGPLGGVLARAGLPALAFSFEGLVVASLVYSLPFVVQPLRTAFVQLGRATLEAAATLGAGPFDRFRHVVVPMTRRAFLAAATLGFAHTLGEFGIVLMIGGNIPGETRTLSIAIFEYAETLAYGRAHVLSAAVLVVAFLCLWCVARLDGAGDGRAAGRQRGC